MAYTKRIPPIKLILNVKEYNTLIGALTKNIEDIESEENNLSINTKEKLLKYSIPRQEQDGIEIDLSVNVNTKMYKKGNLEMYKKRNEIVHLI